MNPIHAGKSLTEWISALRSGHDAERCAAAIALADLPQTSDSIAALKKALSDTERSVQAAARIGLGLDPIEPEYRQKMVDGLLGTNDYERHTILQRLAWLTTPEALSGSTNSPAVEMPLPAPTASTPAPAVDTRAPNIKI